MHPEQIKAAIRMRDTTPAAIADELGVSKSMVSHVISGAAKSARIAQYISALINIPVDTLWPPKPRLGSGLRRIKGKTAGARA